MYRSDKSIPPSGISSIFSDNFYLQPLGLRLSLRKCIPDARSTTYRVMGVHHWYILETHLPL